MPPWRRPIGGYPQFGANDHMTSPPRILLALVLTMFTNPVALADTGAQPDRALQKLLDKGKVRYTLDESGSFKVTYDVGGGRTQLVYVRSTTASFGALKLRDVLSIGHAVAEAELPAPLARRMLSDSAETKLGGWTLQGRHLVYMSKIPADSDLRRLLDALSFTATVADRLEQELSGDVDAF